MEKEQFAAKVRAWRKRKNLSQSKAAPVLGVKLDTLQNWEIARNMPRGIGLTAALERLKQK
jgi:DNA-binding transcriptional regulator YiaG